MAEVVNFNTRLGLKIDTFENWSKAENQFKLLNGEVAIATIAATAGNGLAEPVIMIKIGDGTKTFNELGWDLHAKASDVYAWAKKENPTIDELPGNLQTAIRNLQSAVGDGGSVAETIANAINALDSETKGDGTIVKSVVQTDGKVTVTMGTLSADEIPTLAIDKIDGLSDAITDAKKAGTDASGALDAYKEEMTEALAGKQDVIPENTYDAYGAAAQALADAKTYADQNDADTQYGIEYDSITKKIKLVSDTSKTEIDATDFIKDGMIESVTLSEDGLDLIITWNTDSDKGENNVTTIPLSGLVDVYTGVDGATVKVEVSDDNKISAEVKDGTITKAKLDTAVQDSLDLADSAIQEGDLSTTLEGYYTKEQADAEFTNSTEVDGQIDAKITALKLADNYQAKGDYATAEQGETADTTAETVAKMVAASYYGDEGVLGYAMQAYQDTDGNPINETYIKAKNVAGADGVVTSVVETFGEDGYGYQPKILIGLDTTATFIFNCGSATTVLDAPIEA